MAKRTIEEDMRIELRLLKIAWDNLRYGVTQRRTATPGLVRQARRVRIELNRLNRTVTFNGDTEV